MNSTPEQEEILSTSNESSSSKVKVISFGKKWSNWFYKRSSGGVLASLIFLGVAGGSSMSLESQGFLFAADSGAGGSYIEEVYIDALVNNYEITPFMSSQGILPEDFGVLEFLDLDEEDLSKNFIGGYLSPTNFPNVGGANRRTIVQHTVKEGETMSFIAASYGVSVDTLKWANKVSNPDLLSPGTVLDILPASGVAHIVKNGDTVDTIAKKYKADPATIIAFNAIPADGRVKEGEAIIVPGGSIAPPPAPPPAPRSASAPRYTQNIQTSGYFIAPTTGRNFGRRHANNGVDIANSCGTPIYASADGTVTKVNLTSDRTRRAGGGYGNYIVVKHTNGTETLYAHLLAGTVAVSVGEAVGKGQQVASIGGKPGTPGAGRSTGCHLHFEVHGGSNPFVRR